jgi:O-methyltransferase
MSFLDSLAGYEQYFESKKHETINVLVLSVLQGHSLKMWLDYFPHATLVGVDNRLQFSSSDPRVTLVEGDQEDAEFLHLVGQDYGLFDIIIDDGGHTMKGQQVSLQVLFPFVKPGGLYAVDFLYERVLDLQFHGKCENAEAFSKDVENYLKTFSNLPLLTSWDLEFVHFYRTRAFLRKLSHPDLLCKISVESLQRMYLDTCAKTLVDYYYIPISVQTGHRFTEFDLQHGTTWPDRAVSMIGLRALKNIQVCLETILRENIAGDLVEAGVWKGGASMFMRAILRAHGEQTKKLFICDSFEGLPPPESQYEADHGDTHHTVKYLAVDLESVKQNFRRFGCQHPKNVFVKGWFKDTLSQLPTDQVALLRLDGDMYGSTMETLEALYDKVVPGGFILVDDYGLTGCKMAIDAFRKLRHITEPIIEVTATQKVFWRKT